MIYSDKNEGALLSDFLAQEYRLYGGVVLDDLATFLEHTLRRSLPSEVVRDFQKAEDEIRIQDFMNLITKHRAALGKTAVNYLYHRWIRLIVLRFYGFDEYHGVARIPIVFIPYYPYLDAFITRTPNQCVICFSEAHNDATLRLFRILAYSVTFHKLVPDEPTWSRRRASRCLNDVASAVARGWRGDIPRPVQAGRVRTTLVDYFNNALQEFALAHEYAHFALGHLNIPSQRERNLQFADFKHVRAYDPDLEEELAADMLVLKHMRQPRGAESWQDNNALLYNSLLQFFSFLALCRKHLGLTAALLPTEKERLRQMKQFLFEESDKVIVYKEIRVIQEALDQTDSDVN